MASQKQKFRFFKTGGFEQLIITTPEDLAAIENLDPKLFVVLAMPTKNVDGDAKTLSLIDTDKDGRIRVPEIKSAVSFLRENLNDFSAFFAKKSSFPRASIKAGSSILEVANYALEIVSEPNPEIVSLEQAEEAFSKFGAQPFNGDGIITLKSAHGNAAAESLISAALEVSGGIVDTAGTPGITEEIFENVASEAASTLAWKEIAKTDSGAIFPLRDATTAAFSAIEEVREKVEDFFARARLFSYSPESSGTLNPSVEAVSSLLAGTINSAAAKDLPLAKIDEKTFNKKGVPELPLSFGVNPAWANALDTLKNTAIAPIFEIAPEKISSISETQWRELLAKFSEFSSWISKKPAGKITELSEEKLHEIVDGKAAGTLNEIFAKDIAEAPRRRALENFVRLCCYSKNLLNVLRNYVSFADFYERSKETIFLVGKLYLDARSCDLCVQIEDPAAHSVLAAKSNCYVAYCDCTRKSDGKTMKIAAVFGNGDSEFLFVGRNGVFVDKLGNDWDATICHVVENPISIIQAIFAPYRRLSAFVENQISSSAAARDKKLEGSLNDGAGTAVNSAAAGTTKSTFDLGKFVGIFAAIGLAIGAIGGAIVALGRGFFALLWWQMPLALLGVLVLISLPSVIFTIMKLRRRALGPILDANFWAINHRVKITIPLGKAYTALPKKPKNSKVYGKDSYGKKRSIWKILLGSVVVIAIVAALALKFCPHIRQIVGFEKPAESVSENVVPKDHAAPEAEVAPENSGVPEN